MVTDRQLQQLAENKHQRATYKPLIKLIDPIQNRLTKSHGRTLRTAQEVWLNAIGPELTGLAFPSALRGGILIVSVTEPAVKFTIEQIHRAALLEQLRAELGKKVLDIKCVLPPRGSNEWAKTTSDTYRGPTGRT